MIEVKEVKSKKEIKEFINFPLKLYKNNPYYVPCLYGDEKKLFKKNYLYCDQATSKCFAAYKDGIMVGRIQAIIQHASNKKWNQKRVRFTRFDSIDDQEVASSLFDQSIKWAKDNKMEEIVGPLGFSDLDREGLLIEGFEELSTFEEQYNYEYYQKLIENYGFIKEVDWVERKLTLQGEIDPRFKKITERIMKKFNLHFSTCKNVNEFIKKYADQFFDIIDETYNNIYATVPFTEKMKENLISNFKLIVKIDNVTVIVDENDKVVAFGLCFPSIAKSVRDTKGKLFPFGFVKILKEINHPEGIDLALIGCKEEYQLKGVGSALIYEVMKMLKKPNIKWAETNLNLEDNENIINQWKNFENVLHKRRRCYVKKI
ncbi:MAG: hypothetical protein ACI4U5_04205 [Bacilli bacterium]